MPAHPQGAPGGVQRASNDDSTDKSDNPHAFRDVSFERTPVSSLRDSPRSRNRQNGCASTVIDYLRAWNTSPREGFFVVCESRFRHLPQPNFVILSEAKNLSSIAVTKEGFFASLRMTKLCGAPPVFSANRTGGGYSYALHTLPKRTLNTFPKRGCRACAIFP
jgi:hypothetical protein